MPTFQFEAMDATGQEIKDVIDAVNEEEAQATIRQMGYFVTKISVKKSRKTDAAGKKGGKNGKTFAIGGVKSKQLTTFTRQLSILQDAGLPILRGLRAGLAAVRCLSIATEGTPGDWAAERLHQTAAGIVKGKYAYMAPERLQEKPIDARVDVFSVGVLLYELLAGRPPFTDCTGPELLRKRLVEPPPPLAAAAPELGDQPELQAILDRALAAEVKARYVDAGAMLQALDALPAELLRHSGAPVSGIFTVLWPGRRAPSSDPSFGERLLPYIAEAGKRYPLGDEDAGGAELRPRVAT